MGLTYSMTSLERRKADIQLTKLSNQLSQGVCNRTVAVAAWDKYEYTQKRNQTPDIRFLDMSISCMKDFLSVIEAGLNDPDPSDLVLYSAFLHNVSTLFLWLHDLIAECAIV